MLMLQKVPAALKIVRGMGELAKTKAVLSATDVRLGVIEAVFHVPDSHSG